MTDGARPQRSCYEPAPDRSGRTCDKPAGHDGPHWTYGGNTLTWDGARPPVRRIVKWLRHRFGPLWLTHIGSNVVLAWALAIICIVLLPRAFAFVTVPLAIVATANTCLVYVTRRQAERLGILDAIDSGNIHD